MPLSKRPRKKTKSRKKAMKERSPTLLPDPRATEGMVADITGGAHDNDALSAAQQIIYDAWEARTRARRIALARKALKTSPLCADAHVLLAEEAAQTAEEARAFYQQGVEAGEQALGPDGFWQYAGHFWGFLETRPYMRARAGLADVLWQLGRHEEAIGHYQEMLVLNPNDNQGIRHVLAGHLLARNDIAALKELIGRYEEDNDATWLYTRVLLAFRQNDAEAGQLAEAAWHSNRHVPGVLSGRTAPVRSVDGYITMGGEDEAAEYVAQNGALWRATPGAVEWLVEATRKLKPRNRGW